jgi:hypothetical protein
MKPLAATGRLASVAVALSVAAIAAPGTSSPYARADTAASRLVAVGPMRLADTRAAACDCVRLDASTIRVTIAGRPNIPAGITAVAVNITAAGAVAQTFVTLWPSGTPRPTTSMLNLSTGSTVTNSSIVPVGNGGAIDVFVSSPAEVIVDTTAVFVPAGSASTGRFVAIAPTRLVDTRTSHATGTRTVAVPMPAGISSDAVAVAVNVTSVGAADAGHLSARRVSDPPPNTSIVSYDGTGAAVAAASIVPIGPGGLVIDASTTGHVIVDVVGWFTGPSAPESADGLFVATSPTRLLDTRASLPRLWPGGTRELAVPAAGASAIVTTITLDQPDAPGYVTGYPAGLPRPATSSLNAAARNTTIANFAISLVSDRGVAYYANGGTDLIVDMTGWFTGSADTATEPVPPNTVPTQRVLLIGDSTLAALDVSSSSQRALSGFVPVLDAAPCRRLVRPSCQSAFTGLVPDTAVQAIRRASGAIDVVVVKAGYNEGAIGFDNAVTQVVVAARERGVDAVVWLTYSEGTGSQLARYQVNNAMLRRLAASGDYPELQIADWRSYAATSSGWYAGDRVHLQGLGAWATADYISRWVAHATHRPCPVPWTPGGAIDEVCPDPDLTAAAFGTPNLRALYGF